MLYNHRRVSWTGVLIWGLPCLISFPSTPPNSLKEALDGEGQQKKEPETGTVGGRSGRLNRPGTPRGFLSLSRVWPVLRYRKILFPFFPIPRVKAMDCVVSLSTSLRLYYIYVRECTSRYKDRDKCSHSKWIEDTFSI